jgi:hypothetical protein
LSKTKSGKPIIIWATYNKISDKKNIEKSIYFN